MLTNTLHKLVMGIALIGALAAIPACGAPPEQPEQQGEESEALDNGPGGGHAESCEIDDPNGLKEPGFVVWGIYCCSTIYTNHCVVLKRATFSGAAATTTAIQ